MGWTFVTFEELRHSVERFFLNATFPSRFASSLRQGEGGKAADEAGRFIVNTTVGLPGFFDPATHFGFPRHDEDIGQMLGRWGIPPGPFLMLPVLGPSNPRDPVGLVGDSALNPFRWIPGPVTGIGIVKAISSRALADDEIEQPRRTALDFYVFMRDAFVQNRAAAVVEQESKARIDGGGMPGRAETVSGCRVSRRRVPRPGAWRARRSAGTRSPRASSTRAVEIHLKPGMAFYRISVVS